MRKTAIEWGHGGGVLVNKKKISIISSNRKGKSTSENIYIGQQSSVPSIISTSQFLDSQDLKIRIRNTASISGVISTLQNKV